MQTEQSAIEQSVKHTPTPWSAGIYQKIDPQITRFNAGHFIHMSGACGALVFGMGADKAEVQATAERLTSCVNACAGISNEALNSGIVEEMREALNTLAVMSIQSNRYRDDADYKQAVDDAFFILSKLAKL